MSEKDILNVISKSIVKDILFENIISNENLIGLNKLKIKN